MDPSLIEFPAHSREFRGGFATVAQGFLAPSPRAEGAAKEIEKSSDEQLSSRAGNLQHESDIQNHGDDQRSKDGGADERKASGNNDASKWEVASKDDNAEHERHNQLSIPKIGHEMTPPEDMTYDVPGSGDRDIHSNRGIETRDQQPGREEGTDGQIVNGDSHKKRAETGHDRESGIKEQDGDGQTSKPKVGDQSGSELGEHKPLTGWLALTDCSSKKAEGGERRRFRTCARSKSTASHNKTRSRH